MVALVVVDLFRANMGFNPAIPVRNATPPVTGAIRYLQSRRPQRFIGVSTAQFSQPLPSDLSMRFGLYDARGYDFPVEKRFDALWRRSVAPGVGDFTQPEEFAARHPGSLQALDLLSVSDLVLGPVQAAKQPPQGSGAARRLPRARRRRVRQRSRAAAGVPRRPAADGRGRRRRTRCGDRAGLRRAWRGRDRAGAAGIRRSAGSGPASAGSASGRRGRRRVGGVGGRASASLRSYGAERVVVDATAVRPSLLVLTDNVLSRLERFGRRAAGAAAARRLPAARGRAATGRHTTVVFSYCARRASGSAGSSAWSLLLVGGALLVGVRERGACVSSEGVVVKPTALVNTIHPLRGSVPHRSPRLSSRAAHDRLGYIPPPLRVRRAARERGVLPVVGHCSRWAGGVVAGLPWTVTGEHGHFGFQGRATAICFTATSTRG